MALKTHYTSVQSVPIKQNSRNSVLDLIRVFAAFGVVFIHVHAEDQLAEMFARFFLTLCVPFFFITSLFYFAINLRKNTSTTTVISKIGRRIIIPFLVWSVIYVGLLLIKATITGGEKGLESIDLVRVFLYGESSEQMYYLPELVTMQLLMLSTFLLITKTKSIVNLSLFICPICYFVWGHSHKYFGITPAFHILTYTIAAFYLASGINSTGKNWSELIIGIILITLSFPNVWAIIVPEFNIVAFNLPIGGLGVLLVGLNTPDILIPSWLKIVSSTTFGIYLSHVMFLEAIEFFAEKIHFVIHYDLFTKLVVSFFVFMVSFLFTLFVKQIPLLKPFLLGEDK